MSRVDENKIGERVLGCSVTVHRTLGPGLLENAHEACLAHELHKAGLDFKRQLTLPLIHDGMTIDPGYRLVSHAVIIEVKAIESVLAVHQAQLLSYLKLGGYRLGYLLNFNVRLMKNGIRRIANGLSTLRSPRFSPL
jgi:GxxExxY protein